MGIFAYSGPGAAFKNRRYPLHPHARIPTFTGAVAGGAGVGITKVTSPNIPRGNAVAPATSAMTAGVASWPWGWIVIAVVAIWALRSL